MKQFSSTKYNENLPNDGLINLLCLNMNYSRINIHTPQLVVTVCDIVCKGVRE